MRERIYLVSVISLIFLLWGCGQDPDAEIVPKVVSVTPGDGGSMADNGTITVIFNKEMKSVKISVSDYENAATDLSEDKTAATWHPLTHKIPCGDKTIEVVDPLSPGMHTLIVTGVDKYGNKLEEFTTISFKVTAPD
jgi:hypothetical protein